MSNQANKENTLTDEQQTLSQLSSCLSVHSQECQAYGIERMPKQDFVDNYKKDPIFKNKIELMFKEESRILKAHKELINKERIKRA